MKETINNIHVISKGIVASLILHMIVIGFLVVTGFNTSLPIFTGVLIIIMGISGFYVGTISDRYAEINGIIIAIFTSTIVLLYIAQYTEMDWAVNRIFIASYLVIGFLSSLISRITNKKHKVRKMREKDEDENNIPRTRVEYNNENKGNRGKSRINFPFTKKANKSDRRTIVDEFSEKSKR